MTNGRIDACFGALKHSKRTALVAYLVIGEPNVEESLDCARAALDAGADILELGVPFSDPTADGHVIAAAAYRAIQHGGSLPAALEVATALRKHSQAPLVLFSYVNPLLAFGETRVAAAAKNAGIDGMLLVDLPPEEGSELRAGAAREGISIIPLVAPTTGRAREPRVLTGASGFVYYVSVTGVTGSREAPLAEAAREASALRARAGLPVVVGFGIRTPEQATAVASAGVDGIVVGTAVVQAIVEAKDRAARPKAVAELIGRLRRGLDTR
ncbi:MAG TPA: tryptophan synthase subunit alpha [Polyangiaceae bacterium]|nr:tryptophan synthase subunit alpha [Polyangiaceae bacterium]